MTNRKTYNMAEEKLRKKLLEALKENEKTNSLIIPEADRWDIAGIELKSSLTRRKTKNVKNWYSKYEGKYEVKKKQKLSMGTIRKFGDAWYSQEGDPFGQATIYYLYSKSSSEPENVLVVEVKEEEKKYRVSNITQWVNEVKERIKQNQGQEIIPKLEEIKGQEEESDLNKIAERIYNCLKTVLTKRYIEGK